MKYALILTVLLLSIIFVACNKAENAEQKQEVVMGTSLDTLSYDVQRIALVEEGCVETPENACAKIEINYVNFLEQEDENLHNKLNAKNLDRLRGKEYTNVVAYANGFLRDYAADKAEIPDMPAWNAETNQHIRLNGEKVICVETSFYIYTGGAHGLYGNDYENYDRRTGELITPEDLFTSNFEKKLSEIGEEYFRDAMAIPAQESLNSAGYTFKNDEFYLPENFGLLKDGIVFLYGLYEIASYAQGQQEFVIPYEEVGSLLKEDSVLQ